MTAEELTALRKGMGWSATELARRLDISRSRLGDYERGATRGANSRPAPIPHQTELAIRHLVEHPLESQQ